MAHLTLDLAFTTKQGLFLKSSSPGQFLKVSKYPVKPSVSAPFITTVFFMRFSYSENEATEAEENSPPLTPPLTVCLSPEPKKPLHLKNLNSFYGY